MNTLYINEAELQTLTTDVHEDEIRDIAVIASVPMVAESASSEHPRFIAPFRDCDPLPKRGHGAVF